MKDEIKEILNQLEIVARKHTIEVCEDGSKIETMPANVVDELRLNNYSAKLLLDYITNLQEELKSANESITWWTNRFNAIQRDNKELKKKITFNEKSRRKMQQSLMEQIEDYKSRNEKIIRKISLYRMDDITMESNRILNDLLNVALGEDKDE